ncbi:LuxR C-terminal-related transcriptional regulator [Micromonospora sp. CPCC 205371]|nr:LuxR C-terminal-related transcriptional regulator [Micromonospora sp. CPCC 205371]
MKAAIRNRVRDKIERIAESASDVAGLLRGAATAARQAVPVEGWCGFTLDPVTALKTAGVHEAGLSPALLGRLVDLEYRHGDANLFADLARSRRPAAVLAEPGSSVRFQEVLRPSGYAHELRLVLLEQNRVWGGFVFLRERGSPPFTAADAQFLATLSRRLARGVRRSLLASQLGGGSLPDHPGLLFLDEHYRIASMTPGTETLLANVVDDGPSPAALPPAVCAGGAQAPGAGGSAPAPAHRPTRAGRWATIHGWRLDGPARIALAIERSRPDVTARLVLDCYGLSARERQIAELLVAGHATAQVATSLFLSPHTVRDHLKAIFAKAGVRSRHELVAKLVNL